MRLVKGAYWDTEIKRAQTLGPVRLSGVHPQGQHRRLLHRLRAQAAVDDRPHLSAVRHPQRAHRRGGPGDGAAIATVSSSSACTAWARRCTRRCARPEGTRCRIYAPVGAHSDLLAYLVRRLLENGANSSFVHQIDRRGCARRRRSRAIRSRRSKRKAPAANPAIPKPAAIFGAGRQNSQGWDITDPITLAAHRQGARRLRRAGALDGRADDAGPPATARRASSRQSGQARRRRRHGDEATAEQVAGRGQASRSRRSPAGRRRRSRERAAILRRAADLYEANAVEFFALATREAGKTLADGVAEVREAVDFLRYYAAEARKRRSRHRGARRHRLHLAVEFSAGDLHRPGRGGAGHRQRGGRQAGRADAADRRARGRAAARGRRAGGRAAAAAGRRAVGRRAADRRSAHRRRLLHRLDRRRQADRARSWPRPPRPTPC